MKYVVNTINYSQQILFIEISKVPEVILITYRYTRKIHLFHKFDFDIDVGSVLEVNGDSLRNLRDEQRNGDQHHHQPRTSTTR